MEPCRKWKCSVLLIFIVILLAQHAFAAEIGKYFTRTPQSIVAPPGDRVTFQCETNIPAEQVRWKLNGRFLHPANESDIRISGSFLVVKVSKNRDRFVQQVGDYQCVVEFGAEALTSLPAQLTIAKIVIFSPHANKSLEVVEGNAVAVLCDPPYSNPPPIVQFYKDGRSLDLETRESIVTDAGVLHLYNVSVSDSGNYWCTATNHITTETYPANWLTSLIVQPKSRAPRRPPEFLVKPKPYSVVQKDGNVTLECVAAGNPPPFITWRKLRSSSMTNYRSIHGSLHLFNVDFAQEGEYICEAYNGVGDSLTAVSTVVLNSMPNITKEPTSQVIEEGADASLDCVTEGLPKPRVYWVFNGQTVNDDGNIQLMDWGLRIARVEKSHAGLFQCFASNPMGTVSSPVELKVLPRQRTAMASSAMASQSDSSDTQRVRTSVQPPVTLQEEDEHVSHHKITKFHRGKHKRRKHKGQEMTPPSKPVMNRVSDDSVMVRWTVPPNSGYPIQFFKIQYKEISKRSSRWMTIDDDIPPHIHSYEVKDLKVNHAYRFRIAAVYSNNDNKVGPNSEKFLLQKETAMKRPEYSPVITNALAYNDSAILLRWKHMKIETGGVDGYFIYYRESTSATEYSKVTVIGSDTESWYIGHLKSGISYDMKIQSFNRAGASSFSSIVAAKTSGSAVTETPHDFSKKEKELSIPEDEPLPTNDNLYMLLGFIGLGFWIFLCISCALCYKCKQKRAEEDAKYPCDVPLEIETKGLSNGHSHMNGSIHNHNGNGYIPTITSTLGEKINMETSFVERYNNNRPISPSQLNSNCDLASFKTSTLEKGCSFGDTELKIMNTRVDPRVNSLQRKKHSHSHNTNYLNNANATQTLGSLKRMPYVSCSSEDLDGDSEDTRGSRIFPKEHYKVSRKHNRKRSSGVE